MKSSQQLVQALPTKYQCRKQTSPADFHHLQKMDLHIEVGKSHCDRMISELHLPFLCCQHTSNTIISYYCVVSHNHMCRYILLLTFLCDILISFCLLLQLKRVCSPVCKRPHESFERGRTSVKVTKTPLYFTHSNKSTRMVLNEGSNHSFILMRTIRQT